jgi:hypothetical protein
MQARVSAQEQARNTPNKTDNQARRAPNPPKIDFGTTWMEVIFRRFVTKIPQLLSLNHLKKNEKFNLNNP